MSTAPKKNGLLNLDAAQASITTASVTIRTLRVNNKQLTQATFRQLPTRDLVDGDKPEVLGVIWGRVNYTPPGESPDKTQFVAQFGEELCRCPFLIRAADARSGGVIGEYRWQYTGCARSRIFLSVLRDGKLIRDAFEKDSRPVLSVDHPGFFGKTVFGSRTGYDPDDWDGYGKHCDLFRKYLWPRPTEEEIEDQDGEPILAPNGGYQYRTVSAEEVKGRKRVQIIEVMKALRLDPSTTDAELARRMTTCAAEAEAYAWRWNELMERLKTVPQLFIAV